MDVVSTSGATARPNWRYPDAEASLVEGEWWIRLVGEGEAVLPAGLREDPPAANVNPLTATAHAVLEDLRLTAVMPSDEDAAMHLRDHVRAFLAPDLCVHGRPMFHEGRADAPYSCRYPGPPGDGVAGVRLRDVQRMVNGLDAVRELYDFIAVRRQPISRRVVEDVLAWPGVAEGLDGLVRSWLGDAGTLSADDGRRLFAWAIDRGLEDSGASFRMAWELSRPPDFRLVIETTTGLYIAETLTRLGLDDKRYRCSVCRRPFRRSRAPKHGEVLYCGRRECQRVRARVNQQRSRENRKAALDGQHP